MSIEEQNEMQKIAKESRKKLEAMASRQRKEISFWYTQELEDGRGESLYSNTTVPFDPEKWKVEAMQITNEAIIAGVESGLDGLYVIASLQETNEYFLGLTVDGVTLSERLRDSATYAEKLTVDTVNQHIKNKTTFKRLSNDLTKKRVSKGDLPKYLTELRDSALNAGGDTKTLKLAIKKAEASVKQLAKDGAPTRDLQRAYQRVVDAVKNGDARTLNIALENAIDRKAMYNNDRIARTELAKAHAMAFKRQVVDHSDYEEGNVYIKSLLSPRHNVTDVCDYHAHADLYGVGRGVYPAKEAPAYPYHPHCLCSQVIKVINKDKRSARYSKEREKEYYASLPEKKEKLIKRSVADSSGRKLIPLPEKLLK